MPVTFGRQSKYAAKKCNVHTPPHDSLKECRRYTDLWLMEKAGRIMDLQQQVRIPVCSCHKRVYVMDFVYKEPVTVDDHGFIVWTPVYEDCKGFKTPVFQLKRHLLEDRGIKVRLT